MEAFIPREDEGHGSTEEVPQELRERAIKMAVELRRDPATRWSGALSRIGDQLGINPETLRHWVSQAEIDAGERAGTTSVEARRIAELNAKSESSAEPTTS